MNAQERQSLPCSDPPRLVELIDQVRPFTKVPNESLDELGRLTYAAVFRKGQSTWADLRDRTCPRELALQEILSLVPRGESFILVDEDRWEIGPDLLGRRCIPFLEHEGSYCGLPADDQSAVSELLRLKKVGADFIVFARHSFWWLDHYAGLRDHLMSSCKCLLDNGRLVVFDLGPDNP